MSTTGLPWQPENARRIYRELPAVGDTILWEHASWTVWDVSERDDRWVVAMRRTHGEPHPREVLGPQDIAIRIPRDRWRRALDLWAPMSARMPVCSCHGHPWPCRAAEDDRAALRAMRVMADMAERAQDGTCAACGEVITTRQGRVLAPEPNVLLPGYGPPAFHTRLACRPGLESYDRARRKRLAERWSPLLREESPLPEVHP